MFLRVKGVFLEVRAGLGEVRNDAVPAVGCQGLGWVWEVGWGVGLGCVFGLRVCF